MGTAGNATRTFEVTAGAPFVFRDILRGEDGALFEQADIDTITYSIYDTDSNEVLEDFEDEPVTVANVIFDTPITSEEDEDWSHTEPYNFRHTMQMPDEAGKTYRIQYTITPDGGTAVKQESIWVKTEA